MLRAKESALQGKTFFRALDSMKFSYLVELAQKMHISPHLTILIPPKRKAGIRIYNPTARSKIMTIAVSYTLGFVRCKENNKVLLLNREKAPWMGKWNGIGGKIEPNETSMESMRREAIEETGLDLPNFKSRGILTWEIHVTKDKPRVFKDTNENKTHMPITEGLYLFTADITIEQYENYNTPIIYNDEGILDWKDIAWITHEYNYGIVDNVRFIFKYLFQANENDLFTVKYNDTELVNAEYLQGKNPLSCEK